MMDKIMEWVSKHILLAPFMMIAVVFLFGCRSQKPIVAERTTVKVTQRNVPALTPKVDIAATGKIDFRYGKPILSDLEVKTNSNGKDKPKVDVSIDEEGNLNVGVSVPSDTVNVAVADTTTNKETVTEVEVEKELSWWQHILIYIGGLFLIILLCKFAISRSFTRP